MIKFDNSFFYKKNKFDFNHNKNFTAAHLLKLFPNNETIKTIVSLESNEKSEDLQGLQSKKYLIN